LQASATPDTDLKSRIVKVQTTLVAGPRNHRHLLQSGRQPLSRGLVPARVRVARVGLDCVKADEFDLVHEHLHCSQAEDARARRLRQFRCVEELRLGSRSARMHRI
jgi:hypothetical protein